MTPHRGPPSAGPTSSVIDGADAANTKPAPPVTFSVVTAAYNAAAVLPQLIASLVAQTDQDFEWIVADGGSTDGTLELLEAAKDKLNLKVDSRPDFGIYDALNRAIKLATGDYYLVMGADDELFPEAVAQFKSAITATDCDFVSARCECNGQVTGPKRPHWEWLYRQFAHVTGHAACLAIRKQLHAQYGMYSHRLPIAADQLFILKAIHGGARVHRAKFVSGKFNTRGLSGTDKIATFTETLQSQVMAGHSPWLQLLLFNLKMGKYLALRSLRLRR